MFAASRPFTAWDTEGGVHGPGEVRETKAVPLPWFGSAGAEMKQTSVFGSDCI